MDVPEDGGLRPDYVLKLNSYDLGVDIELADAVQRIRFEHPETQGARGHQRQGQGVLLGREHLHARHVGPRLQGQLLQVHQRDPPVPGGHEPGHGRAFDRRPQRHRLGRRLRVGHGLRSHRPLGRRQLGGQPARGAAARRPAGHRRAHAPGRQAQGAPRSGGRLLHRRRGRARQARRRVGPHRRDGAAQPLRGRHQGGRDKARREARQGSQRPRREAAAARAEARGQHHSLQVRHTRHRPGQARRRR